MDEYISRDAALEVVAARQREVCPVGLYGRGRVYGIDREIYDAWQQILDELSSIPEAVIHCADCVHTYTKDFDRFCPFRTGPIRPDGYCDTARRRDP